MTGANLDLDEIRKLIDCLDNLKKKKREKCLEENVKK